MSLSNEAATRVYRAVRLLAIAGITAGTLGLSGCGALNQFLPSSQPTRDATTGEVTEGAQNGDVFSIRVGDCVNTDGSESEEISSLPIVPCSEPHADEAYYSFDLPESSYPGDDSVSNAADEGCIEQFGDFIGTGYESTELEFWSMYPTKESWASGDREVLCFVYDPAGQTTGSLKGSAR